MKRFRHLRRQGPRPALEELPEAADAPPNPFDAVGDLGILTTAPLRYQHPPERPGGKGWTGNPFGPFQDPRDIAERRRLAHTRQETDSFVDNDYSSVDIRGLSDWITVWRKDLGGFVWGQLLIDCQAQASATQATMDTTNHGEVRIVGYVGGQAAILAIRAVGNHSDRIEDVSPGPMFHRLEQGEVPDRIEIQARARQGGVAETAQNADEILTLSITSRFHR